ncbi:hypothetical protein PGB90_000941 [Kerria lacca]
MDESGLTTVMDSGRVLSAKGTKQVGRVTALERGPLVTIIAAINAVGNHVPPLFVFPRVNFKSYMLKGAPPGSIGEVNKGGWTSSAIFNKFLHHFAKYSSASRQNHVLLVLDNHDSDLDEENLNTFNKFLHHFANYSSAPRQNHVLLVLDNHDSHLDEENLNTARELEIVFVTLPPHISHKLQSLDRTVFGPLKTYYSAALERWNTNNPGCVFSIYDIAEIVGQVYGQAFSNQNITSGFRCTGIYPMNPEVFTDTDFLSSFVTDRPAPSASPSDQPKMPTVPSCETPIADISPEDAVPYRKAKPRKISKAGE